MQTEGCDIDNFRSTTGYIFQIGGAAVSWKSKRHDYVAQSTAEAEYMALASTAQEAVWMRELNADMKNKQNGPTAVFEDIMNELFSWQRTLNFMEELKKYHCIRQQVTTKSVKIKYCHTEDKVADTLAKGLTSQKFERLRRLCIRNEPASEECESMTLTDRQ
uniref:Reverse transcriptase Ty1/copia-type domain-containing protein n=1 Tax=Amphimedon queenslandica TaxID=400682 RepID=A0A1X7URZ1_AMPQE